MTETVVNINNGHNNPSSEQPKTNSNQTQGLVWLTFNIEYFKTLPGLIKIVELILGILCMGLASPAIFSSTHFFLFVVVICFIATLLWSAAYLLGIREVISLPINWILTELINTGSQTILYFIGFILQLLAFSGLSGYGVGANIAAGVFGLFNTLVYAVGTYFLYVEHKNGTTQ